MNNLKYVCVLIVSCLIAGNINAQELTDEQLEGIQMRVAQKVEELEYKLQIIADKSLSPAVRKEHVLSTLRLFIGNGDKYSCFDEELEKYVTYLGVKIHMVDKQHGIERSQLLKKYIYRLYNPETGKTSLSFNKINIEATDAVICDNVVKVGEHYECTAFYHIKAIKKQMDGRTEFTICPSNTRKIRCYIQAMELSTGEKIFHIKIGDIYTIQE